jgi:NADH-quinone oxidoreductase subunit M
MAADVLLVPLIVALACALPIGGLARPLAVLSGLIVAGSAAGAAWLGVGGGVDTYVWAAPIGAQLAIGADGFASALIVLAGILFAVGAAASGDVRSPRGYFALWSLLQAAVVGVLVARDLLLFFAAWDALPVPLALLVSGWGGADRRHVTMRLVATWLAGSALLFTGIVALGVGARTFAFADLAGYRLAEGSQVAFALLFLAGFAVRVPLFPFHAWLPRLSAAAPVPVTLVANGAVTATAVYAVARICLVFFPLGMNDLAPYLIALSAVGTLYAALLATRQRDTRAFIAYVSVSQLNLIALGAAVGEGTGALLATVSHGLVVASLFLLAISLARRVGSFGFGPGGLGTRAPVLGSLFVLALLAAIGVPGTSGAPGALLILAAVFSRSPGVGLFAAFGLIASAVYAAGFLRAVFFGPGGDRGTDRADVSWRERGLVVALLVIVVALGVAPRVIGDLGDRGTATITRTLP